MLPSAFLATIPWRWVGVGLTAIAICSAVLAYGEWRADGREAKVNARWEAAAAALEAASDDAAASAEDAAVAREEGYAERLKEEKEKIDEALEAGADPLGALFPSGR